MHFYSILQHYIDPATYMLRLTAIGDLVMESRMVPSKIVYRDVNVVHLSVNSEHVVADRLWNMSVSSLVDGCEYSLSNPPGLIFSK